MMQFANVSKPLRGLALLLVVLLAGCSKDEKAGAEATPGVPAPAATVAAPPAPAVSAQVQAMGAEELRAAASKALAENRIYAPGGDNAVEYYLALRDKQPSDATVTSALTDLMPYTLIATEQSIGREDFAEAQRLAALIEKADPKAPALPRLKQSIATTQKAAADRVVTDAAKAVTDAETKVLEQQRQVQQAEQQKVAAEAIAAEQRQAATRAEAERVAAARAAEEREAAQPTPPPAARPAATPPPRPAAAAASELRIVSAPPPSYPREALRSNTAGEVLVEITVGTDGSVTNARVVRSTPPRVFDREALNAVRRWQFAPIDTVTTTRRTIAFNPG